ncbi:hypothetical protein OA07_05710 [Aphanizomenon flos-aquae 2012/KM1/D3]|nr:hypothetical protein OA07_05710 [Aphanizomenon flos-aquae 2012/KM1/D3]
MMYNSDSDQKIKNFFCGFFLWGQNRLTFFSENDIFIMGMRASIKFLLMFHYINILNIPQFFAAEP